MSTPEPPETPDLLAGTVQFMTLAEQLDEPDFPETYHDELRQLRRDMLAEECAEYCIAEFNGDLVGAVDGLLDIIVIAWGSLLAYVGEEKAKAAAAEVVRANLSKVDGTLGPIQRREDGKILKPEGWTPPDIAGVLQ